MTAHLISSPVLDKAAQWAQGRYHKRSPNSDVWHVLFWWNDIKADIQRDIVNLTYTFEPLRRYSAIEGIPDIWAVKDAIVLKALSECLKPRLLPQISPYCYYRRGVYSVKDALNALYAAMPQATYFFRSDIKSYYATMNAAVVLDDLSKQVTIEPAIRSILNGYFAYVTTEGGLFWENTLGISLRCPLSPLLGIFYLNDLDVSLSSLKGIHYSRYMDDWVILADTRHHHRHAIRQMYAVIQTRKQGLHPDKTFAGKVEQGFDFLGMRMTKTHLMVGQQSFARAAATLWHLWAEGADFHRLRQYWHRWIRWIRSGIPIRVETDHWLASVLNALRAYNPPVPWLLELERELKWDSRDAGRF